jgi:hypothetical protein
MAIYRVVWDNGADATGTFPCDFDTREDADAYGREWADECNMRDFGTLDPDDGYTYEVVDVPDEQNSKPTDEDLESHEGIEHDRMRTHETP